MATDVGIHALKKKIFFFLNQQYGSEKDSPICKETRQSLTSTSPPVHSTNSTSSMQTSTYQVQNKHTYIHVKHKMCTHLLTLTLHLKVYSWLCVVLHIMGYSQLILGRCQSLLGYHTHRTRLHTCHLGNACTCHSTNFELHWRDRGQSVCLSSRHCTIIKSVCY